MSLLLLGLPAAASAQTAEDDWAPPAGDDNRSTSGDMSLLSGRTLGVGEVVIAAALGWPGLWAHVELALTSDFNLGIRAGVLYGSPMMGLGIGAGGHLDVPMRIHLWGERDTDIALRLCPRLVVGEGSLLGEVTPVLAHALGVGSRLDAGLLVGLQPDPRVTLIFGFDVGGGISWVEGGLGGVQPIGVVQGRFGVEGLLARDTTLFGELTMGGGLAPDQRAGSVVLYPDRFALGVSLGLGYLL